MHAIHYPEIGFTVKVPVVASRANIYLPNKIEAGSEPSSQILQNP